MERPHFFVFANCKPIFDSATRDRWHILKINERLEFVDITQDTLDEHEVYVDALRYENDQKTVMKRHAHKKKWRKLVDANMAAQAELDEIHQDRQARAEEVEKVRTGMVSNAEGERRAARVKTIKDLDFGVLAMIQDYLGWGSELVYLFASFGKYQRGDPEETMQQLLGLLESKINADSLMQTMPTCWAARILILICLKCLDP